MAAFFGRLASWTSSAAAGEQAGPAAAADGGPPAAPGLPALSVLFDTASDAERAVAVAWAACHADPNAKPNAGADTNNVEQPDADPKARYQAFLAALIGAFAGWAPSEGPRTGYAGKQVAVGCRLGHPTEVVGSLAAELRAVEAGLGALAGRGALAVEELQAEGGLRLLHALSILLRSHHNREVFCALGGVQSLGGLMRTAAALLRAGGDGHRDHPEARLGFLQSLLVHAALVVAHFADADLRRDVRPADPAREAKGLKGSLKRKKKGEGEGAGEGAGRPGPSPLETMIRAGVFEASIEILGLNRELRRARGHKAIMQTLDEVTLQSLQGAASSSAEVQRHVREIGGLETLIALVGPPEEAAGREGEEGGGGGPPDGDGRGPGRPGGLDGEGPPEGEREGEGGGGGATRPPAEELRVQLLALSIVFEFARSSAFHLQKFIDTAGLARLQRLLLWAATTFREDAAAAAADPRGAAARAAQVARVDESPPACVGLQQVFSVLGEQLAYGSEGPGESLALLCLRAVLATFEAEGPAAVARMRAVSRAGRGLYQHYVVQWLSKLLRTVPAGLNACRKRGAWQVVCGEHFFGFPCTALGEAEVAEAEVAGWLGLQQRVLLLLEQAINLENSHDSVGECSTVVDLLEAWATRPAAVGPLVASLRRVLEGPRRPRTIDAFYRCNVTSRLAAIVGRQQQVALPAAGADAAAWRLLRAQDPGLADSPVALQRLVLDLLRDVIAASEQVQRQVIREWTVIGALFTTMWEPALQGACLALITSLMRVSTIGPDERLSKSVLFTRYLEALPRAQAERATHGVGLVLDLLEGIRATVASAPRENQRLLLEAEAILQVSNLLNETYRPGESERLCVEVIETLTSLLRGSHEAKKRFNELMDGDTFFALIRQSSRPGAALPFRIVEQLLDLATDGQGLENSTVISNADIVPVAVRALRECGAADQLRGLAMIQRLLKGHIAFCSACQETGLTAQLLRWLGEAEGPELRASVCAIVELIGSVTVAATDLRLIFKMILGDAPGARWPAQSKPLLRILQTMAHAAGPSSFFDFNGSNSGLVQARPIPFAGAKGYTFCAWLRHERHSAAMPEMVLELTAGGGGDRSCLSVVIDEDYHLKAALFGARVHTVRFNFRFPVSKWYHLGLVHSAGGAFTAPQLQLHVNGRCVETQKLTHWKHVTRLAQFSLATATEPASGDPRARSPAFTPAMTCPLMGQVGTVWLFQEALTEAHVEGLFKLGPNYCSPYFPKTLGLHESVVLGFNAQASRDGGRRLHNICETSAVAEEAEALPGTKLCATRSFADILYCLGGVSVLLPLVQYLDGLGPADGAADTPYDPEMPVEVIKLFSALLQSNAEHRQAMWQVGGFALIGHLLKQRSPRHLSPALLRAMEGLVASVRDMRDLYEEATRRLLLDLRLWSTAPAGTQREYYRLLLSIVQNEADDFSATLHVGHMVDILRGYYWVEPSADAIQVTHPDFRRPNQGEVRSPPDCDTVLPPLSIPRGGPLPDPDHHHDSTL